MKKGTCTGCGGPAADYRWPRCWQCRWDGRRAVPPMACIDCGATTGKRGAYRCGPCGRSETNSFRSVLAGSSSDENSRLRWQTRNRLDAAAPGPFNAKMRARILAKWQKQGRKCSYCLTNPTEHVDHVIPLSRGGTNYEGNLAPSCASCNYAKWDNLLSAWRYGLRARRPPIDWISNEPPKPRKKRTRNWADPAPLFGSICPCGIAVPGRAEFCSTKCAARTAYRRKVGIPDNAPAYSVRKGAATKRQEAA